MNVFKEWSSGIVSVNRLMLSFRTGEASFRTFVLLRGQPVAILCYRIRKYSCLLYSNVLWHDTMQQHQYLERSGDAIQ